MYGVDAVDAAQLFCVLTTEIVISELFAANVYSRSTVLPPTLVPCGRSVSLTLTVSVAAVLPVRSSRNVAVSPSGTLAWFAKTDTTGRSCAQPAAGAKSRRASTVRAGRPARNGTRRHEVWRPRAGLR